MNQTDRLTVSQVIAKMMKAYGAEHMFTLTGFPLNVLYHCQRDEGIPVILGRSERSVVAIADGYARIKGKPTFSHVQTGVGGSSLPPALAEAMWGHSPVMAISGSTGTNTRNRLEYQEVDSLPMMGPATKWAGALPAPGRTSDIMRTAIRAMLSGVPGPSYLELPSDGFAAPIEGDPQIRTDTDFKRIGDRPLAADAGDIEKAVTLLAGAKRPIILSGGEVIFRQAWDQLLAFAEALSIPVLTSPSGKGSIVETHPLSVGQLGRYGRNVASAVCAESDLVLAIGTTLGTMTTDTFKVPRPGTAIIHIAIDEMSLGRTYEETLSINADPKSALDALTVAAGKLDGKGWAEWTAKTQKAVADWRAEFARLAKDTMHDGRINPIHLIAEINTHIGGDDVVVSDTGSQSRWTGCMIDAETPGLNFLRAAGSLGWSFPGAIGAKLAAGNRRRVFNLIGDGGMGYHATEMETAMRYSIPLISVVMNNAQFQGYAGLLSRGLGFKAECPELSSFTDVDFGAVAKAFGGYGECVLDPAEIRPALSRAEESGLPAIINVAISGGIGAPHGAAGAL